MRNVICMNELNEVMNCKSSAKNNIIPGMGATMFVGSDRYAMVVTEVITPKKIKVNHVMNGHMSEFKTNENGIMILPEDCLEVYAAHDVKDKYGDYISSYHPIEYTLRKNGRWMPKGKGLWETCSIRIGHAENYRDPSF